MSCWYSNVFNTLSNYDLNDGIQMQWYAEHKFLYQLNSIYNYLGKLYFIDCSISTGSFLVWIHFNIKCVFFLRNRIICSKLFRKHHSSCSFPATYLLSIFCGLKSPNLQSSLIFAAQEQLYIFFLQQSSIRCADNSRLFYSWPNNRDI